MNKPPVSVEGRRCHQQSKDGVGGLHRGGAGEEIINFTRSILRSKHTLEKIGRGKEEEMEKEKGVAGNEHTDRC